MILMNCPAYRKSESSQCDTLEIQHYCIVNECSCFECECSIKALVDECIIQDIPNVSEFMGIAYADQD